MMGNSSNPYKVPSVVQLPPFYRGTHDVINKCTYTPVVLSFKKNRTAGRGVTDSGVSDEGGREGIAHTATLKEKSE